MTGCLFDPINSPTDAKLATLTTSLASSNQIALAARVLLGMGYQPVLIEPRSKKPVAAEWQKIVYAADQDLESTFTAEHNLGVRLGASKLVDADLDSRWARALADAFLPKSTMVWGRKSEPSSHRAYRLKSASTVKYKKYSGVTKNAYSEDIVLLERRAGSGHQTVVPPSIHKDTGEKIEWVAQGPATEVDAKVLSRAFDELAAASLIASVWQPMLRHNLALAVPAFLLKAGCPTDILRKLLDPIIDLFDDAAEVEDRKRAIDDTIAKYQHGEQIAGAKTLREIFPDTAQALMAKLTEWLDLGSGAANGVPTIDTRNRNWGDIFDEAFAVLVGRNQINGGPPTLFQRGGQLVRVRVDEDERPKLEVVSDAALRGRLAREIGWLGTGKSGSKIIPPRT
jgi:hypothetical protein